MLRLAFKRRSVLRARINPEKVLTVDSIHTKISLIPDRSCRNWNKDFNLVPLHLDNSLGSGRK